MLACAVAAWFVILRRHGLDRAEAAEPVAEVAE